MPTDYKALFAQRLKKYMDMKGFTRPELIERMKVSSATASDWCNGKKLPRMDKIEAIASWLGVETSDLLEAKPVPDAYYLNDEAKELAQFLFENPEYKVLFDASRKVSKEDIGFVKEMLDRMRGDSE